MVDIHSHILSGLDDGAKDFETSVLMLRIAAENGTTDIVATPHSDLHYSFQPDQIAERVASLQEAVGDSIRIHSGCDFHLHFDNIRDCLESPGKYTINHKRYLLVEFADNQIAKTTSDVFDRMLRVDITPVVTHPERNPLLQKRMDELQAWVRMGCLCQVTGQSFLGRFGKSAQHAAEQLMDLGLVHFVASDAHDPEYRPPNLKPAYDHVSSKYGDAIARTLFVANPRSVLTGEYIEIEEPELARPRKWYQLW